MSTKPKIKLKIKSGKCSENPSKPNFSVIKTSLRSILKDYDINFPIINQLVIDCHQLVTRTYQFIRLYLLNQYFKNQPLTLVT